MPKVECHLYYYAFGSPMASRTVDQDQYRFGFNGKENDGETSTQDYGLRIYNPALGKFLSVDPLFKEYPWISPYAFAENEVIRYIDIDGGEKGKPVLPTNGEIFSALAESIGLDTKSRRIQAIMGFQDAISSPNSLVNMGQHRIETLVENPWRLLAPVDIYFSLGELRTSMSTIVEGIKKNDPYYNGMAMSIILQMMAGVWNGGSGMAPVEAESNETQALPETQAPPKEQVAPKTKTLTRIQNYKSTRYTFEVCLKENNFVSYTVKWSGKTIEFGGHFTKKNGILKIEGFAVDGEFTNQFGPRLVLDIIKEFGRQQGVKKIEISGKRTTGAKPGKIIENRTINID